MFEYLIGLVGAVFAIKKFQLANRQARSEVISSLRDAIRLTIRHIQETREGEFAEEGFSDFESRELATAWSRAALAIRPFNRRLANTFEQKSDYWTNPTGFRHDIEDGRRRFDYMFRLSVVIGELNRIEHGGL